VSNRKNSLLDVRNMGNLDKLDLIEFKKIFSKINKEVVAEAKNKTCALCNKEVNSFCNSHSLPTFILKKISKNGQIYTSTSPLNTNILYSEQGVNNAGTFHNICPECDKTVFQRYENIENLSRPEASNEILNLIALKSLLRQLHAKQRGAAFGSMIPETNVSSINNLDILENRRDIEKIKNNLHKEHFTIIIDEVLDYVVPLAIQDCYAIGVDLKNNIINDLYSLSRRYTVPLLYVSIFPLQTITRIIVFYDKSSKRYRQLSRQIRMLELEQQLALINYTVFKHSESVFLTEKARDLIKKDTILCDAISIISDILASKSQPAFIKAFSLSCAQDCTNLLAKKHAISNIDE